MLVFQRLIHLGITCHWLCHLRYTNINPQHPRARIIMRMLQTAGLSHRPRSFTVKMNTIPPPLAHPCSLIPLMVYELSAQPHQHISYWRHRRKLRAAQEASHLVRQQLQIAASQITSTDSRQVPQAITRYPQEPSLLIRHRCHILTVLNHNIRQSCHTPLTGECFHHTIKCLYSTTLINNHRCGMVTRRIINIICFRPRHTLNSSDYIIQEFRPRIWDTSKLSPNRICSLLPGDRSARKQNGVQLTYLRAKCDRKRVSFSYFTSVTIFLAVSIFFFNFLYIEHCISKSFFALALGGLFRKLVLKIGISFAATIGVRRVCVCFICFMLVLLFPLLFRGGFFFQRIHFPFNSDITALFME